MCLLTGMMIAPTVLLIVPMALTHGHWLAILFAATTAPLALILWFLSGMALSGD